MKTLQTTRLRPTAWLRRGCFVLLSLVVASQAPAAVTVILSEPRVTPTENRFEVDLQLQFSADLMGGEIELLNLDIVNSNVKGTPLTLFNVVEFEAALPFDTWAVDTEFGVDMGFESQMILSAFGNATSMPFTVTSTNPISLGTFDFQYGSLGLQPGDQVTLDVTGVDEGAASRTTSVAFLEPGMIVPRLINPSFLPGSRTVTISAVPEPSGVAFLLLTSLGLIRRRHRSK